MFVVDWDRRMDPMAHINQSRQGKGQGCLLLSFGQMRSRDGKGYCVSISRSLERYLCRSWLAYKSTLAWCGELTVQSCGIVSRSLETSSLQAITCQ